MVEVKVIFLLFLLQSCVGANPIKMQLNRAETCMETQPEQSLQELSEIDYQTITNRRLKARYALLYSMALDKNYIDLTNDSIISPAVSYYKRHGSSEDKLKLNYYLARIYMNAGDYESAMTSLVNAEMYAGKCRNYLAIGRLYSAKMQIFQYLHDTKAMADAARQSAEAFMLATDTTRYLNAVSGLVSAYLQVQDTVNAITYLDVLKEYKDRLNLKQKSRYYSALLFLKEDTDHVSLIQVLNVYLKECPPSMVQWVSVALAYHHLGMVHEAKDALDRYLQNEGVKNSSYYWADALVNESLGNYESSLRSYQTYVHLNGDRNSEIFINEARFIEERMTAEMRLLKKNYTLLVIILLLLSVVLATILIAERIKRVHQLEMERVELLRLEERKKLEEEKEKYSRMYEATRKDIKRLERTLKNKTLGKEICTLVEERLNVLNGFIAANISRNFTVRAYEELARLMEDQKHFLTSTRASFCVAHPNFLAYLQKNGLAEEEIEYCCLYCIGLNGSEIISYLNKPSIYNLSVVIRRKLGVDRTMRIDTYLHKIMSELD